MRAVPRRHRRPAVLVAFLVATLLPAAPATARHIAGTGVGATSADADDPAWSVDADELQAAIECSDLTDEVGVDHDPVLLVHGTGTWGYEQYNWSYSALLDRLGMDWCTTTYPDRGMGDMQVSAEYVAYAAMWMHAETGRKVDIVGHSQGAILPRWAVKYWPSAAAAVDDLVLHAPPSHGTTVANPLGLGYQQGGQRPAVAYQFLPDSDFIRTLNARDETPGDVDYTVLWTTQDQLVQPSYGPTPTAPLEGGAQTDQLTNLAMQDACTGRLVDHLSIGTTDRVAAAATLLALVTDGPLDLDALSDADVCAGPDEAAPLRSGVDGIEEQTGLPFGAAYRGVAGAFPDFFQREGGTSFLEILARESERGTADLHYRSAEPPIKDYAQDDLRSLDPARRSEGVVADNCRQLTQDEPQQPCDFLRAATWGTADACRAATRDDAQCAWLNGEPVGDAQVDAYAQSWIAEAHAIQRSLQRDLPLRHAVFVATHNSYNGYGYTPTLSRLDANQTYAIYDQLRLDVRRLELDIHWWYGPGAPNGAPVTCHATSVHGSTPVTRHVGCTTEDTLDIALADVRAWLDEPENADEVLIVRLETHLENAANHATTAGYLEAAFGPDLYRPAAPGCTTLPLDLTAAAVRAAGKRVLLVGDCGYGNATWNGLVFEDSTVRTETTHRGEPYTYPACGGRHRPADDDWYATRWVRRYEDATVVSSFSAAGGAAPKPVTPQVAREWSRCGINQPSFDHLTPTDGRLEALVWSFTGPDLDAPVGDCAQHGTDGRFHTATCVDLAPAACSDGGYASFELTPLSVVRSQAPSACAALGLELAVPRTGYEAERLREALLGAGGTRAWIDLTFSVTDGWVTSGA